ncbi:MAG: hypothetical protein QOF78_762 [Phycisphaerales bacterium]|jgi:hypothetical protein|nr:hypothetical protein [Phycisphaerales bacterium]
MTTDPTPTSPSPANRTSDSTAPGGAADRPHRGGGAKRVVKWIFLIILLVLIIGGVALYMNLNGIVRSTVEKQSASSLQVPTKLESANVSLFGGNLSLRNFHVGQPQGFAAADMMSLGGVDVDVKISELRQDPVRVRQITIRDPKLLIEMKGRDFNIKKFIDQLPPGEDKPVDDKPPMKLIINDLQVQGAQVIFRPDVAALSSLPGIGEQLKGMKQEYALTIPPLAMQNVGTGEGNQNGAQIKEIVSLLVTQLAAKATESEQLPPELRQVLSMNVADITNLAKQKLGEEVNKQLGKVSEDLQKKLPGGAGQAVEGILKDPGAAVKDPGKAIQQGLGGLINKKSPTPAPAPTTTPAPAPATPPK